MNLKKIWKNRKQIYEGIKNSVIRDKFVEDVSAKRMLLCKDCIEFYSINQSTQKLEKNRWKLLLDDGVIMELSPY